MPINSKKIPASQLVLNQDGSVYHLNLLPDQIADTIILVGDPGRVARISNYFDRIELKASNREMNTHTGFYKGRRLTVLSTGMGTDNIEIVLNELDALVNIDLKNRQRNIAHRRLQLIRLGTSGALQADIAVGESYVAGAYALGLDGLLYFYDKAEDFIEQDMTQAFMQHTHWSEKLPTPYIIKASDQLLEKLAYDYRQGITATAPGFYAPQGRSLRLKVANPKLNQRIESFQYQGKNILNFEMESSALYGLSKMMGHDALTINLIIANRVSERFTSDYTPFMEKLIQTTLDRLVS
ncbi:MAG: nucleoside phosphorylase [Bacteroidales bacterium]|jgi:uridine phosphorylase|nr:nucleoside phosphorylase [Bacteroidales bacterium]MCK9448391.1 nucleoside phosphorylase [Bacteroidales bacterium]MDD3700795.1 nucleoside phosphorylase [Bacteroidales bacterium]MDY0370404.1 nucleoside phosphorylase [Bacteroidales bacterium]